MIIRCTGKLLKEMGVTKFDLSDSVNISNKLAFEEWYAHVFILNRKKQIVFAETQTLFSFCLENVTREDIRGRLRELFEKGLSKALFNEEVSSPIMSKIMEICRGESIFAKTENRRTNGAINELIKQHKFAFWDQSRSMDRQDRCNRYMPMRGFPDGSKDYRFPIDEFAKAIKDQFDLEFIPEKENTIHKIYSGV